MTSRDSQTVILSRQAIVLVTEVGVGLLTLCYVLGVQVGKQSAALRHPLAKGAGEDLQELPASVAEQLKAFERPATSAKALPDPAPMAEAAKPEGEVSPEPLKAPPAKPALADKKPEPGDKWSLQLVSTPDAAEAQRMAVKAKSAGFPTVTIAENGLFKVRLTAPASREAADATALKLKNRGYKPFVIRVQ